ncbi:MAG: tRNA (adenosine(37)-N6)-dimethylallyltransferase MiaA [Phocaeicola sp.]|nr:tRNA (adenosine(37)-N6)-dimethylallyltransferase MiaA [Phocaeicola sp.]MDD7447706.1 tRNA (adenosine(37)-N6)-dimethylallyltransferase MiaA [Prevotellaceae bacterium]MDY5939732.1 tRNA (adenosine(37)-N6)-dimethylallyltransferase MiaA [Phocaeicola sp.]
MQEKPTLIVLLGPTGIGKTDLSLSIATALDCEIISADSRQLYRDMQIGTAAPTAEQLQTVPHHFVGTLGLEEYYSAAQYETDVLNFLSTAFLQHDKMLLTGGSMMYIDAVCDGIDDIPTISTEVREKVMQKYKAEGLDVLCEELRSLDPQHYAEVDLKNPRRVIHAIEVCYMTGNTFSSFRTRTRKERPFHILKIGLQREREELFNRINARVDAMIEGGLVEEARRLYSYRHLNALNTVGYKELFAYFDGEMDLSVAIEKIKKNTRVYAKKQMTWFKKDTDIHWFHPDKLSVEEVLALL